MPVPLAAAAVPVAKAALVRVGGKTALQGVAKRGAGQAVGRGVARGGRWAVRNPDQVADGARMLQDATAPRDGQQPGRVRDAVNRAAGGVETAANAGAAVQQLRGRLPGRPGVPGPPGPAGLPGGVPVPAGRRGGMRAA